MAERAGVVRVVRVVGVVRGAIAAAVLVFLVVLLAACQATVQVGIDVGANGAGTVSVTASLDRAAAAAVPNLAQMLHTADLQRAGWRIDGPIPAPSGGSTVTASKGFRTPAEATEVIGELSGATGPFHDLKLARRKSLLETKTSVSGTVDLTCGIDCFSDPQLQKTLGPNLGLDPAKLAAAGIDPAQIATFEVDVRLPGSVESSNAPARTKGQLQWPLRLGAKVTLAGTSRVDHRARLLVPAITAGVVVVVVAVAIVVLAGRRRRRRRRRRPPSVHLRRSGPLHSTRS